MRKTGVTGLMLLLFTFFLSLSVSAEDTAVCRNGTGTVWQDGKKLSQLLDGSGYTRVPVANGTEFNIVCEHEIGALYLEFCTAPGEWTLISEAGERRCGENGFLHEYIPSLSGHELTLRFQGDGELCDIFLLSRGERPDWVQDWQPSWDRADVLLLPAHSDDDQLFFAGVIPWCLERGARVQVAYLVSHNDDMERRNELLDGLWCAGLRNYPVLGEYDDIGRSTSNHLPFYEARGIGWEVFEARQVELYRRFQPQVVITHAEDGEYGHGAHKFYESLAVGTIDSAGNPACCPASAEQYGVWTPRKVYVHNWPEHQIRLDLDSPLPSRGMSAFEVSLEAFRKHTSQFASFSWWICSSRTAAGLELYNPAEYGLYATTVGYDDATDTFFDHITLYDEEERMQREAEEARLLAEQAAEEQRQAEEARLLAQQAAEEQRQAQQAAEEQRQTRREQRYRAAAVLVLTVVAAGAIVWLIRNHPRKPGNTRSRQKEK